MVALSSFTLSTVVGMIFASGRASSHLSPVDNLDLEQSQPEYSLAIR